MSDASSAHEMDAVLAQVFVELERAPDPERVVEDYCGRYPAHADAIRKACKLDRMLGVSTEPVEAPIPERLGDFRIVRQIAKGGMGIICEAIQEPLGRRVAVKIIRRGRTLPTYRERFLREQRVLARLHQTHIVPVFASGEEQDVQYFAMPFIDGAALDHVVRATMEWHLKQPGSKTPPLSRIVEMATGFQGQSETAAWDDDKDGPREPAREVPSPDAPTGAASQARFNVRKPPAFSQEYFESVARVMIDVAESLDHAHQHGFVHRDLKPANIMVSPSGESWVIDFGLAGYLNGAAEPQADSPGINGNETPLHTRQVGTPGYWSPEQREGREIDQRTDVWGLGVTLYELLTLRPAFAASLPDTSKKVRCTPPPACPRSLVKNVPRDLDAICDKAIRTLPKNRYLTAGEFANDLRRWLHHEPTTVYPEHQPARTVRRAGLWARRNKGWAFAVVLFVVFLAVVGGAQAQQRVLEAQQRVLSAARKRDSSVLKAQRLLAGEHVSGWSNEAMKWVREAAHNSPDPNDQIVRNSAAATLIGLDTCRTRQFDHFGAERVLFDPEGKRVLMGSVRNGGGMPVNARLWDSTTDRIRELPVRATGPLAFGSDGTPLSLQTREKALVVTSLENPEKVKTMQLPDGAAIRDPLTAAMLPDASRVVAAITGKNKQRVLAVWDGRSGELLQTLSAGFPSVEIGSRGVLTIAADGSLLAEGDKNGVVRIWSIITGEEIATLRARRSETHCLRFARDPLKRDWENSPPEGDGWLLAAGDAGGAVTIWDLGLKTPRSFCRGNYFEVIAAAFSPDGVTLASAGRGELRLWDVATGRLLMTAPLSIPTVALAYSPDGQRLALGHSLGVFRVSVWELERGRGVNTLRGLSTQVASIVVSPDDRVVAALSRDWQVGIWNRDDGRLLHLLDVSQAVFSDNAAIALSPDGSQLAIAAGRQASLWDVESSKRIRSWNLWEGLVDRLVFPAADTLLSFRIETRDKDVKPYGTAWKEYPRICRIRNLLGKAWEEPLAEINDFNRHVFAAAVSHDGKFFAVDGLDGTSGMRHIQRVFDIKGKEVYAIPSNRASQWGTLVFGASGTTLAAYTKKNSYETTLLEIPSGRFLGVRHVCPERMTDQAEVWALKTAAPDDTPKQFSVFERDRREPLVTFSTLSNVTNDSPAVNAAGTLVAWGTADGAVYVADLPEVGRRLTGLGLKWKKY